MTAQPQDRKPKANQMVRDAISLQAANLLQKAQLDMMATKLILSLKLNKDVAARLPKVLRGHAADLGEAWNEQARILSMTRDEVKESRATFTYPDERIQAVLNEATDKIAAILLDDVA